VVSGHKEPLTAAAQQQRPDRTGACPNILANWYRKFCIAGVPAALVILSASKDPVFAFGRLLLGSGSGTLCLGLKHKPTTGKDGPPAQASLRPRSGIAILPPRVPLHCARCRHSPTGHLIQNETKRYHHAPNFSSESDATFQMSSLYSWIARSDEKYPHRATLRMDIRAHCSRLHQTWATRA